MDDSIPWRSKGFPASVEPSIHRCVRGNINPMRREEYPNTKQDRAKVAGGRDNEVRYEAEKTGKSKAAVKDVVKSVGTGRTKIEEKLKK
jgi:hypothetical protein